MATPIDLTFGVEFEFIVRFKPENYKVAVYFDDEYDQQQHFDEMVRNHMIGVLGDYGFLVNQYLDANVLEKGYDKWGVIPDGSIDPSAERWNSRSMGFGFTPVEVRSPVFLLGNSAFEQIEKLLQVIKLNFDVFVNSSCGLHVHVGNWDKGFSVGTVKNLCLLVTGFERQLNSLHPRDRIDNLYTKPPSRALPPGSMLRKLADIEEITIMRDLVEHFNSFEDEPDAGMAYNLMNLVSTKKNTIEFRQHAAALDPTVTIKWVETVTGLVSQSHQALPSAFQGLLLYRINDTRFSVIDLFHALNLHDVAEYYERRGIYTHPPQEWESDWVGPSSSTADRMAITDGQEGQSSEVIVPDITDPSVLDCATILAHMARFGRQ